MSDGPEALQAKVDALQARVTEWEQFFHEHNASRDEGYEAARARYWPKVEAANADIVLLKTALRKLIDAAREAPASASLDAMVAGGEFALMRADRTLDVTALVNAANQALGVLEGRVPPSADTILALREALRVPKST